ncbi:MAG: periplasmic serine protease [Microbacterium sp.]|nr:periplasmic serine protease [Microbacterium sp.]
MRLRTTSTQRTYRYVRLSIVGATLVLAVSIGLEVARAGVLPSISAAFYTPAGNLFVGSLCAIALALLVLSGRSIEQGLLDVAAVFALVVALVPTPFSAPSCPRGAVCVPAAEIPGVINNGVAVASVSVVVVIVAAVLARTQANAGVGTVVTLAVVALLVVGFLAWALIDFESFVLGAHNVAAVGFFGVIGLVAAVSAWRPQRGPRRFRALYGVVAGRRRAGGLPRGVRRRGAVRGVLARADGGAVGCHGSRSPRGLTADMRRCSPGVPVAGNNLGTASLNLIHGRSSLKLERA